MLASDRQSHVATPNSEMLVEASHNAALRSILQSTALNIPDSAGLLFVARMKGEKLPERVTGVDTVRDFCAALASDIPVFLLGGAPGIAERAADALRAINPHLSIAGTYAGSPSDVEAPAILKRINASGAKLLLVAYGVPSQETWIARHLSSLPAVRVAIGVGGTFDFLAGAVMRAPFLLRNLHLEWAWRLLLQPWRIKRILRAVIVFPWLALTERSHPRP